ncbi:MAG: hypothetical protein P8127_04805 [Acidobacteriota bacterium]
MHHDEIIDLFQTAAADREHGAMEIERTLIHGLLESECKMRLDALHKGLRMLAEGQPAMANLRSMAAWMAAISRSSAVAAVVEGAWQRGWKGSVAVLDGTAAGRGAEQAERLACSGTAVAQPDAAAPELLDRDAVVVLIGADAIGRTRFVNATGTAALLEAARAQSVETVLVADTGKVVEEGVVDEIVARSPRHREAPDLEWPIFEAVPLALVSVRVTE